MSLVVRRRWTPEISCQALTYLRWCFGATTIAAVPMQVAEQFHAAIPGAELAIIPNAGHLSNMEQADAFNEHVRRFCQEHDVA